MVPGPVVHLPSCPQQAGDSWRALGQRPAGGQQHHPHLHLLQQTEEQVPVHLKGLSREIEIV